MKLISANDRRLFNGPVDKFMNLNNIKYRFLWNAYLKSQANTWFPQEISLSLDIEQWRYPEKHGITENDKQMVKYALGFFAVADSLVADNILLNFYRQATAPELQMFLLRQVAEEAVHTHSYQYIIESLEINSDEIFEMHLHIAEIYNKMNFADRYDGNLTTQLFVYYGLMEGIFFYAMFAIILEMARKNKFPGVAKQFEYIMRDEAMHLATGLEIFKQHVRENNLDLNKWIFNDLSIEAKQYENNFIYKAVANSDFCCSLLDYIEYIRRERMRMAGFNIQFEPMEHSLPWMDEYIQIPKLTNFFESTVTDYQMGGQLDWNDFYTQ